MFWLPFALIGCAALVTRLTKFDVASRCLTHGLLGSFAGYVIAPLVGALVGSVPSVMIEPRYFIRPFMGCIAPSALFLACTTLILGILLGFATGGYIGFRRGAHA